MAKPLSPFRTLWDLGYRRIVPITPPGAEISKGSSLFKRVGTPQDARGKAPGKRGESGEWFSFDWVKYEAAEADLQEMQEWGAGVGQKGGEIRPGVILAFIDVDTIDPARADAIEKLVELYLGSPPKRVGRAPKALYPVLVSGLFPYAKVMFGKERVEVLTEGRQAVFFGIHPGTGEPYYWPRKLVPIDDLPMAAPAQMHKFLEAVAALPEAGKVEQEGSGPIPDQATLAGALDKVRAAIAALPNTDDLFASRDSFIKVGYALKAALPDDGAEALELWREWTHRWENGKYRWEEGDEDAYIDGEWKRMKPPFKVGASWLFEQADEHSGGVFVNVPELFDDLDAIGEDGAPKRGAIEILRIGEILNRPPPRFLIDRHLPEKSMGFLYSKPGAGKSFLALDMALSIAHGFGSWQGDKIDAPTDAMTLYIAAEGSYDARNRIKAWLTRREIAVPSDRFLMIERTINFMKAENIEALSTAVFEAIGGETGGRKLALVVVDTVSRAMPGADENLQKEMTLFVAACDRIVVRFGCCVIGVHHAGKSGDMRGSTVLLGAGDFVFRLSRKEGAMVGSLKCEKQKAALDGWAEAYRFDVVSIGDGTSLVPSRCEAALGGTGRVTPAAVKMVFAAMRTAWDDGAPWSRTYHGGERMAARRMTQDFDFTMEKSEELIGMWIDMGLVIEKIFDRKTKKMGLYVINGAGEEESLGGVFD